MFDPSLLPHPGGDGAVFHRGRGKPLRRCRTVIVDLYPGPRTTAGELRANNPTENCAAPMRPIGACSPQTGQVRKNCGTSTCRQLRPLSTPEISRHSPTGDAQRQRLVFPHCGVEVAPALLAGGPDRTAMCSVLLRRLLTPSVDAQGARRVRVPHIATAGACSSSHAWLRSASYGTSSSRSGCGPCAGRPERTDRRERIAGRPSSICAAQPAEGIRHGAVGDGEGVF